MTHKLSILDPTGHTEYTWDSEDGGGLAVAEKAFATEMEKKSFAVATGPSGTRKVTSLNDLKAGEDVVVAPQMQGG